MEYIPKLSVLYLYLTDKCNLHCRHCWVDGDTSKNHFIKYEQLEGFVNRSIKLGLRQVNITGGEPTLHRNLLEIIHMFYEKEVDICLNTNGVLLTEKLCSHFSEYRNKLFVSVSVDGAEAKTHDSIRGCTGAYDKTWRGIEELIHYGVNFEIIYTLQKSNMHELRAFIQKSVSKGVKYIKINFMQYSSGKRVKGLIDGGGSLSLEDILFVCDEIKKIKNEFGINIITNLPYAFYSPYELQNMKHRMCGMKHAIGVLADGSISLCGVGELKSELVMGNIVDDSLEEIWSNNEIIRYIRDKLPEDFHGICKKCSLAHLCCGYCMAQNYMETGQMNSSYSLCEQLYEQGLFPHKYLV